MKTDRLGTAAFTAFALGVGGCSSNSDSAAASPSATAPDSVIAAAGSTFVGPLMTAWVTGYEHEHPKDVVSYNPIGSGAGIEMFKKGSIQFAASDAPIGDERISEFPPMLQIPGTAGPVCVIYNLPGAEQPLRLTSKTLAEIFLGNIINWQDPAIAADNSGVKLPRAAVILIHRSDGSGTTSILTTYLSKVSPEWASKVGPGLSVQWPAGLGADGSEGVLALVKRAPGTIGYLELNYAKQNGLQIAAVQNNAREFVVPSPESAAAAIDAFQADLLRDLRSPIVDPPASAKAAYPISGLTFLLLPKDRQRKDEQTTVKNFVEYAISTGQRQAEQLSYARLPPFVQQQSQALLAQLMANGRPLR